MVADADVNARIQKTVLFQHRQKQAAQRHLAGGDIHRAVLQIAVFGQLRLARINVLHGNADVLIQSFALRRQLHPLFGSQKQRAAQLGFQLFDGARHVRLVVQKQLCRL